MTWDLMTFVFFALRKWIKVFNMRLDGEARGTFRWVQIWSEMFKYVQHMKKITPVLGENISWLFKHSKINPQYSWSRSWIDMSWPKKLIWIYCMIFIKNLEVVHVGGGGLEVNNGLKCVRQKMWKILIHIVWF